MNTKTISKQGKLFISGKFNDYMSDETFEVINPATEEVIAEVSQANANDVNEAVCSARAAFNGEWSKISASDRGEFLFKLADLLERDKEEFIEMESIDNGKPILETRNVDIPLAIKCLRYYGGLADKIQGETIPVNGNFFNYTLKQPVGVVGQIIPWNFPLLMLAWKIGPALAAGCTVVLKPAEQTPLTALKFAELVIEAELPKGVINIITGDGRTGQLLVEHEGIDKIAFTGSTEVGKLIGEITGRNLKKVSLELGGKAPNIVFANANIDDAVKGAVAGIFFNQGEVCCAGSRLFVQESIKEEFLNKLKAHAKNLNIGNPLNPAVQIGALVSKEQYDKVINYIIKGQEQGAKLITGGEEVPRSFKKGYFITPTILEATDDNICAREEIFGPVVTVLTFKDKDNLTDLITRANDTEYGLSAGIWTRDIGLALRFADEIKAGTIWINCYNCFDAASPFGGFKASGIGRELGVDSINLYTEKKSVWIAKD